MPPVRDPIVVKAHTRKRPTPKKAAPAPRSDAAQGYGLKRANAFKRTPQFHHDIQAAGSARVNYELDKLKQGKRLTHVHHENPVSAFLHSVYGTSGKGKSTAASARGTSLTMSGPVRSATNLGAALATHPVPTTLHTASGLAKTALNLPGGLAHIATQSPLTSLKEIGADYAKRYGETDAQMRKRFVKEGAAPEVFDALGAYGGVGAGLGKIAKSSELMSAVRPALRTGGGAARTQEVSGNLFRAAAQRGLDKYRAHVTAKHGSAASYEEDLRAPAHVIEAHRANQAAGSTVEVAPLHGAGKAQRVGVAKLKSRGVQMLKSEQQRRIEQHARPIINQLNTHERKAFYAVAEGWAPADAAKAIPHLQSRKNGILATRKAEGIDNVRSRVDEVRKIDDLIKHAHEAFTPKVGEAVRALRKQDIHVGRNDPGLTAAQRLLTRYGPQAAHLGLRRGELPGEPLPGDIPDLGFNAESVPAFIKRVQAEADKHGLERPLYFPHEADALANNPDFASRALGGSRAVNAPKRREYKLFNRGTRDTSPQVYLTGLARSIKRKHNWNLVADQFEHNVLPGLSNMTLGQLKNELRHRGVDPKDVAFWNPGRFRRALKDGEHPETSLDHVSPAEESGIEQLQHAITDATHPSHELAQTKGWAAVPKAAHDEIMAAAKPQGRIGRSLDIANSKQSRLLLGINPAWNAFQVMSNVGLGTLATAGKLPLRLIEQQRLYHKLSPEGRDRIDALVGEGAGTHGAQVHLGATSKGRVTRGYREFKQNPFFDKPLLGGPTPRQVNPLEAGFAFDRFQNKHFRRAVLVDDLKSQAKSLDPSTVEQMIKDPAKAEHAAEHLDKWLGDYTSYTHRERMGIKKAALFYGYLRHSLNVLTHTLPADHPVLTSILAKVGQLQQDELKKLGLSGVPWASGKFYFTKNGKLQSVDLGRANPLANSITDVHNVGQAIGVTPPVVQIIADQLAHRDIWKDKSWAVDSKPASATANLKGGYFNKFRPRILLNQGLEMSAPYRALETMTEFGPQGVDSLPFSQRPTTYKRADYKLAVRKQAEQDRKDASLLHVLAPFLPHPSHDAEIAKSLKNNAPAKAKKKSKGYFHQSKGYNFG